MHKHFRNVVMLFGIGLAVYTNTIFNKFVGDDFHQIINNSYIYSITNIPKFFQGSTYESGGANEVTGLFYRPLMMTGFTVIHALVGLNPAVYHLIQVLLHVFNTILVYFFLLLFLPQSVSLLLALIFLIHPVNTEAVVYIANLQEVLFFLFGMTCLFVVHHYKGKKMMFLLFLSLVLSLFSKETGILFGLIVCLYTFLFFRKKFTPVAIISITALCVYLVMRYMIAHMHTAHESIAPISQAAFLERIENMPLIFIHYVRTFFFPVELGSHYFWIVRSLTLESFLLPLLGSSIVIIGLLYAYQHMPPTKNKKYYLFFFLWFLVGMLLHIQLIPLDATVADRWFYLPFVGFIVCLYFVYREIVKRNKFLHRRSITYIGIVVLCLFALRSFIRTFDWRDEITLYSHDIQVSSNFILANALGTSYITKGDYKSAKPFVESSYVERPYYGNINNMAIIYASEKNIPKAKEYFLKAVENSNHYMVYENYSSFLILYGFKEEAAKFTKESLEKFPRSAILWFNTAKIHKQRGNLPDSMKASLKAYEISGAEEHYVFYKTLESSSLE